MPTMESIDFQSLFCLFKGVWGTRKSTQALSFPKPQYWFSFDQKMGGIYTPMKLWGIDPKLVTYDDYNALSLSWNKAEEKMKSFRSGCPFKTIVVDHIGAVGDAINGQTIKEKAGSTNKGGEESGRRIGGIPINTIEDYKAETSALRSMNIILIAHVQPEFTKESDPNQMNIIVTGARQAAYKLPGHCQEVYHFQMKGDFSAEPKYSLLTSTSRNNFARTSLMIDKEIVFENDSLYDKYLVPAMKKTKEFQISRF
jgi:hypothetical protein